MWSSSLLISVLPQHPSLPAMSTHPYNMHLSRDWRRLLFPRPNPPFLIRNYKYEDAERWSLSVWECASLWVPMRFALQSLCIWEQQLRTDGRLLAFALMSNSLTGLLCVSSVRSAPESLLVLVYNLLHSNFRFSCKWKFDKGHMISRIPSVLYVWSLWLLSPCWMQHKIHLCPLAKFRDGCQVKKRSWKKMLF